jgi:hypothetical protein
MNKSIDSLIDSVARCTICGAPYGQCDCWVKCKCGYLYEKGTKCKNPKCNVKENPELMGEGK